MTAPAPWRSVWCGPGRYGEERPLPHSACYDSECGCPCHDGPPAQPQYVGVIGRTHLPHYRIFDDITHLLVGDTFTTLCGKRTGSRATMAEAQQRTATGRIRGGVWVTGLVICKRCQKKEAQQ